MWPSWPTMCDGTHAKAHLCYSLHTSTGLCNSAGLYSFKLPHYKWKSVLHRVVTLFLPCTEFGLLHVCTERISPNPPAGLELSEQDGFKKVQPMNQRARTTPETDGRDERIGPTHKTFTSQMFCCTTAGFQGGLEVTLEFGYSTLVMFTQTFSAAGCQTVRQQRVSLRSLTNFIWSQCKCQDSHQLSNDCLLWGNWCSVGKGRVCSW